VQIMVKHGPLQLQTVGGRGKYKDGDNTASMKFSLT